MGLCTAGSFPPLASESTADATDEVPDVMRGDIIAIQLLHYLGIDGLEELCACVTREESARITGDDPRRGQSLRLSFSVKPEQVQVSWLADHYDNHPEI